MPDLSAKDGAYESIALSPIHGYRQQTVSNWTGLHAVLPVASHDRPRVRRLPPGALLDWQRAKDIAAGTAWSHELSSGAAGVCPTHDIRS